MHEGGYRAKAGQSVRMLDVLAARAHGCWDDLHGSPSGAALSDALKRAAVVHHGHAGRALLERLTRDPRDFCEMAEAVKALPMFAGDASEGQDKRAYTFTAEGMREAVKGFDFARALDALQEAGALPAPRANGEGARFQRINGRGVKVYPIAADKFGGERSARPRRPSNASATGRAAQRLRPIRGYGPPAKPSMPRFARCAPRPPQRTKYAMNWLRHDSGAMMTPRLLSGPPTNPRDRVPSATYPPFAGWRE